MPGRSRVIMFEVVFWGATEATRFDFDVPEDWTDEDVADVVVQARQSVGNQYLEKERSVLQAGPWTIDLRRTQAVSVTVSRSGEGET